MDTSGKAMEIKIFHISEAYIMENEPQDGGTVGLLLCDGGGCKFLDQVFLCLEPADLKSSRLV